MTGSWVCSSPLDRRLLGGDDADALLVARSMAEFDSSVSGGEQGVVAAHPDVLARIERAATLPDDDRAGMHLLAVAALHAQALPDRVPAVLAGAPSLLVGHRLLLLGLGRGRSLGARLGFRLRLDSFCPCRACSPGRRLRDCGRWVDGVDPDPGQRLSMTGPPAVLDLLLELEDDELWALRVPEHRPDHRRAVDDRRADRHRVPIPDHQDPIEGHRGTGLTGQALDFERGAGLDPILLSAGDQDGVHDLLQRMAKRANVGPAGRRVYRAMGGVSTNTRRVRTAGPGLRARSRARTTSSGRP